MMTSAARMQQVIDQRLDAARGKQRAHEEDRRRLAEAQEARPRDLRSLRTGIFAAGMLSATPVVRRGLRALAPIKNLSGFGMTETNAVIGALDGKQRPGTMGRAMPGYQVKVVDENDEEVPDGTPGELVMRADEAFAFATGYWRRPEQTIASWRNLWFHSGDRAVRDPDGSFRFLDRLKDAIRRRGQPIAFSISGNVRGWSGFAASPASSR